MGLSLLMGVSARHHPYIGSLLLWWMVGRVVGLKRGRAATAPPGFPPLLGETHPSILYGMCSPARPHIHSELVIVSHGWCPTERLHSDYALDLPCLKTHILDKEDRKQSNQSLAVNWRGVYFFLARFCSWATRARAISCIYYVMCCDVPIAQILVFIMRELRGLVSR